MIDPADTGPADEPRTEACYQVLSEALSKIERLEEAAAPPLGLDVERLVEAANSVLFAARKRPVTREEESALALLDEAADTVGARLGEPRTSGPANDVPTDVKVVGPPR